MDRLIIKLLTTGFLLILSLQCSNKVASSLTKLDQISGHSYSNQEFDLKFYEDSVFILTNSMYGAYSYGTWFLDGNNILINSSELPFVSDSTYYRDIMRFVQNFWNIENAIITVRSKKKIMLTLDTTASVAPVELRETRDKSKEIDELRTYLDSLMYPPTGADL